jgi:RsiW-degrading membrane proteinase PrsW (M82 family)
VSTATSVRPTPQWARATKSLRQPAFWLTVALIGVGGWRVGALLRTAFGAYPTATVTAVALFALYAVPFWLFVDSLDYLEREPPLLQATAFAWGALVATSTAIPGNTAVSNLLAKLVSPEFAVAWGPAIAGPTNEELLKTLGIVAIVLIARAQVNSVLDGVVYGALVGLGFQVVEDVIYAVNAVALAGNGDHVAPVVATFFLRGFLAGLWSHTLFSALAGAGIAYLVVRTDRSLAMRSLVAAAALLGAWSCHFVWNSPWLADGFGHGALGVIAALLLKGIPPLLLVLWMVREARNGEAHYYTAYLEGLHDPAVATVAELHALPSGRRRVEARKYAARHVGMRGRKAVGRLQRAQARLAVALSRADPAAIARCRRDVLTQRQRLRSLGHPEAIAPPHRHRTGRWLLGVAAAAAALLAVAAIIRALGAR